MKPKFKALGLKVTLQPNPEFWKGGWEMARKTIVVVDDDLPSVELLVKLLRAAGHEVHYFYDGNSAMRHIFENPPDLVLSDMLLPKVHGLDLCRQLKRRSELAHIPVVLMTGVYRDPRHREEVKRVGANAFYTKPFNMERLINDLQELMGAESLEVPQDEVREEIDAVVKSYEDALPTKLRELEMLADRLEEQKGDVDALAYLHLQVHALAGSSATFGFNEVAKWAAATSSYLRTLMDSQKPVGKAEFIQIRAYLGELAVHLPGNQVPKLGERQHAISLPPGMVMGERRLVYLVDSNVAFANEIALQIELLGFRVIHFPNEDEMIAAREMPDAIIMEFEMPEGQLIRVSKDARLCMVPLILISSENSMHARLTGLRVGGQAFFTRPPDVSALVSRIDALAKRRDQRQPRVLLVCTNSKENERLSKILQSAEMIVKSISDPAQIMGPLASFAPDMLLIHSDITGCSARELVRLVRQEAIYQSMAILVLDDQVSPVASAELLGEGADEILDKSVSPGLLATHITHRAERFGELRSQMVRDSLTGLLNRSSVMHSLHVELQRARRQTRDLVVAILDIDEIQRLNRMFSHTAGNVAIRSLATMLSARLRSSDVIGRYEGPMLMAIFPDTELEGIKLALEKIAQDFSRYRMFAEEQDFYATFCCGLAAFPRAKDSGTLLEQARISLEEAKTLGGNRVV